MDKSRVRNHLEMRISNSMRFLSAIALISSVLSETLSLQGNMVHEPIDAQPSQIAPNLRECARICMEDSQCLMLIYNTNDSLCLMATVLTETPTKRLDQYELAYLRGPECAEDRRMEVQTIKMGYFFNLQKQLHYYMQTFANANYTVTPKDPYICYSSYNVAECNLVPFGSATGGTQLTTNTSSEGFVPYGYCAIEQGSCNAYVRIFEYPMYDDFHYIDPVSGANRTDGKFLCNFWSTWSGQCTPWMDSSPFSYVFQMEY